MSTIVQIEDVFQDMLLNLDPFVSAIPDHENVEDHIFWMSTFEEEIETDALRPFAICIHTPFAAKRTTEGDDDIALFDSGVYVEFQRNHEDFSTDDPQASRKSFKDWYGKIIDEMSGWKKTDMQFIRFEGVAVAADACRTEIAKRKSEDDFWAVGLHFEIDGGGGD